ncbi:MAG: hypothetical protein GJV46_10935 [Geobacter sp.]|nr:hypothetical protein [Geobacter sp.]
MIQKLIFLFLLVSLQLTLTSCGSSNMGGGAAFNTVNASVSVDSAKNPLLSDLAAWPDQTAICTSDPTKAPTIVNDLVNFTITSKTSITNGTPSALSVQKVTLTFTPADTLTPALPSSFAVQYTNLSGSTVPAGGSVSIPVEVATHNFKNYFWNTVLCQLVPVYSYNVTVAFDLIEVATGKAGTIAAGMVVRVADFADK